MSMLDHPPPALNEADSPPSKRRTFRSASPESSGFTSLNASSPSLSPFSRDSTWSPLGSPTRPTQDIPDLPTVPRIQISRQDGLFPGLDGAGTKPSIRPITSTGEWRRVTKDTPEPMAESHALGNSTDQAAHIQRLQSQLANVSDFLSGLVVATADNNPSPHNQPPSSSLMFTPNILRSNPHPNKQSNSLAIPRNSREADLEVENERLKEALRIERDISARQRRQITHTKPFESPPIPAAHGIDPQAISELANDLICGLKPMGDVVSTLLDLVDRAGGTTVERERERLHPLVRLHNAEGVLDITMDRVTALEKDTKSFKRSADCEAYRQIEASCLK